jgi:hypothetical protein
MRSANGYRHLKKGSLLPRESLTRGFNQNSSSITSAKRDADDTDLQNWFQTDAEIDASEEIVGLGDYGKTLTIITADIPDEDDQEDKEWAAPRFKY